MTKLQAALEALIRVGVQIERANDGQSATLEAWTIYIRKVVQLCKDDSGSSLTQEQIEAIESNENQRSDRGLMLQ